MGKHDDRVPAGFANATSGDPAVQEWASRCAAGEAASLLVLGAHWSGKTYTMYAAYRAAMAQGLHESAVSVPDALSMTSEQSMHVLSHYRVVLIDPADSADPEHLDDVDGLQSYVPREGRRRSWDEPEMQAMMAVRDSAWQQLIERLAFSTEHATVFTATSEWTLQRALPPTLVTVLLHRPTVMLASRPRPRLEW